MTYEAGYLDDTYGPVWNSTSIHGLAFRQFGPATIPASTAWPANNDAYFIPFLVAGPVTFEEMFFISGAAPGTANFDLGIYSEGGTRIASIGATACVNTADIVQPAGGKAFTTGSCTLSRGRYYMAMSAAATTVTARANVNGNGFMRALGMQKMATAHPLPATATFASMGTTNFMPTVGMTTITNIL